MKPAAHDDLFNPPLHAPEPGKLVRTTVWYYGYDGEEVTKDNILGEIKGTTTDQRRWPDSATIQIEALRLNHCGAPWITDKAEIARILNSQSLRGGEFHQADFTFTDQFYNWQLVQDKPTIIVGKHKGMFKAFVRGEAAYTHGDHPQAALGHSPAEAIGNLVIANPSLLGINAVLSDDREYY